MSSPRPPKSHDSDLSKMQVYTSAGLLITIVLAGLAKDILPIPLVIATAIGYGIGSSISISLYRVASLLKDGTTDTNVFGSGLRAGLAVAFGMVAIQSVPAILSTNYIVGQDFNLALFSGLVGAATGFIQSRSNFAIFTM